MAKKSSSPVESSSPKQKSKSKKPVSNGNADIRSFFAPAQPKKLSFSDDEDDTPIVIKDSKSKVADSTVSKKDNSNNNKNSNHNSNNNSNSSNGKLSKLKRLKKEESSDDDDDDDDFSLSEEESNKKNSNGKKSTSTPDKKNSGNNNNNNSSSSSSSNNNNNNNKFKSIVEDKSPKKSKPAVSKKIDLSSDEELDSKDEVQPKKSSSKQVSSLKRKEKPDSSSEDEKHEEKKRKVKTPEKKSSTPIKSPSKSKTPEKKVKAQLEFETIETSPAKKVTPTKPESKTRIVDDIVKVEELYLSLKPKHDDIFAENQVSAIPKRHSDSSNSSESKKTPEKSTSLSQPLKKLKSDEEISSTTADESSKEIKVNKSSNQEKFNQDDIFASPKKPSTPTKKSTSSTPIVKKEKKFNEDDIFDSPPPPSKPTTSTSKSSSTTETTSIAKKEKRFNDDDIFSSPPKSKSTTIQRSTSKFNDDDLFDEETDSENEMKIDGDNSRNKKSALANKLKKAKQEEYGDDDDDQTESEETESEGEEKGGKSTKSKASSSSVSKPPAQPTASSKKQNFLKFKYGGVDSRGPPPNLGKKPLPVGKPNCLAGKTFFFTGILDSLERENAQDLVKRYGGHVAKSVVKKLTHLVAGIGPGDLKIEKAKKIGAKIIDEDKLFEMISSSLPRPPQQQQPVQSDQSTPSQSPPTQSLNTVSSSSPPSSSPSNTATTTKTSLIKAPSLPSKPGISIKPTLPSKPIANITNSIFKPASSLPQFEYTPPPQNISMSSIKVPDSIASIPKGHDQLWVEKYKPKDPRDLIGNNTVFEQLSKFLQQFNSTSSKDNPNRRNAALLSGPPGIGKTSAAILLCKKLGFEPIELNASDTRSKSEIERVLKGVSESRNISHFFSASSSEKEKKNAIILDEIDGSSGNSDRGGISEIIQLIKKSKVPFICICNDYYSTKIKSLKNYCMDLRIKRPTAAQVTTRLLQICKHEGMKVSSYMIEKMFASTHSDIRQTINSLQMLARSKKVYDDFTIDKAIESKDFDITPFSAVEQLFKTSNGDISTQLEYFFSDFSLVPLLVQENYLSVQPFGASKEDPPIEMFSNAADAICESDEIGRAVGKEMAWQLLPSYGVASTILPAGYVRGYPTCMPLRFPSFLGKYSNASKQQRFVKDLQLHMRSTSKTFSNINETRLYYVPMLKHYLIEPLVKDSQDGIDPIIKMMDDYGLTEDDRNNIIELSTWGKDTNLLADISSQLKAAFTKKFRAGNHAVYDHSLLTVTKGTGDVNIAEGYQDVEGEESNKLIEDEDEEASQETDDITKSNLIKKSSTSTKSKSSASASTKSKSSTSTTKSKSKSK